MLGGERAILGTKIELCDWNWTKIVPRIRGSASLFPNWNGTATLAGGRVPRKAMLRLHAVRARIGLSVSWAMGTASLPSELLPKTRCILWGEFPKP